MEDIFVRVRTLLGDEALKKISSLKVIIFGVGGVGSVCAEALVRSGVENLTLVDNDVVAISNLNRQLCALTSTIGKTKVDVLKERFLDINPLATIKAIKAFYSADTREQFHLEQYDVVIDAIDSLSSKIDLLVSSKNAGCQVFSSLGAAGKLDPTKIHVTSIWKTSKCPLGKLVRNGLRKKNFTEDFYAVYSEEKAFSCCQRNTQILGSFMPVTAAFGLALASLVITENIK